MDASNKRAFGAELENFASEQIKAAGYQIVEMNFLSKLGEIDIIARDKKRYLFVEVRYRKNSLFGGASASVDLRKQKKLINTARLYLQQNNLSNKVACRFDVFAIEGNLNRPQFNWIENAFGE